MNIPEKIFIPKKQILDGLMKDLQNNIEDPNAVVDSLEWKKDGIVVHISKRNKVEPRS